MRQIRHPLVEQDIIAIAEHVLETTDGNVAAAERRLDEIDALLNDIAANPFFGFRLSGSLDGWLVRHGGRDYKITIVFRPDADSQRLHLDSLSAIYVYSQVAYSEIARRINMLYFKSHALSV